MEKLFTDLIMLVILLGGAKIVLFHMLGKARNEMAATTKNDLKGNNVIALDHYKYIYSQDEVYGSLYHDTQRMFNAAMKNGQLSSEQVRFIERYLKNELHIKDGKFKNNAHAVYSMLKSPLLDNSNYNYLNQVIKDFTKH